MRSAKNIAADTIETWLFWISFAESVWPSLGPFVETDPLRGMTRNSGLGQILITQR
jgi:hypothetical protein